MTAAARPGPLKRIVCALVTLVGVAAAGFFLLGRFGSESVEALASPWTAHAWAVLLLCFTTLSLLRAPRMSLLLALPLLWASVVVVPVMLPRSGSAGTPSLRVVSMNVLIGNRPTSAALEWLRSSDVDLVGVVECSSPWQKALAEEADRWPHHIHHVDDLGAGGVALFSRYPFREARTVREGASRFHSVEAIVETPDGPVRVLVVHPVPPMRPQLASARNTEIGEIADRCAASDLPTIVLGDFNETPYGRAYRAFLARTGFLACRAGAGATTTWPARIGTRDLPAWLGIAIDHCFVSPHFEPLRFRVGPDVGSDHLPIVAELRQSGT